MQLWRSEGGWHRALLLLPLPLLLVVQGLRQSDVLSRPVAAALLVTVIIVPLGLAVLLRRLHRQRRGTSG
jgi:hypothetical protein